MFRWFRHQHVIFDCDSTLSRIEGIDELAEIAGVTEQVKQMTDAAMAGSIALEEVYGKRLELIKPTQDDIFKLKQAYKNTATQDAQTVIQLLKDYDHDVYIVSGGLLEPVREFGISIGVPEANIRAVGVDYNQLSGQWWLNGNMAQTDWSPEYLNFHQSPLTLSEGKRTIISELIGNKPGRSMLIGDGMSDLLAATEVDTFVGYGGVVARENVKLKSEIFIQCESLSPILVLAGGKPLIESLTDSNADLYQQAVNHLKTAVRFTDQKLEKHLLT